MSTNARELANFATEYANGNISINNISVSGNIAFSDNTVLTTATSTSTTIFTATIIGANGTSDWVQASNTDPWIATKNVEGILVTDRPTVSLNISNETFEDGIFLQKVWNLVYRVEASDDDEIKFYAIEEPFANLNVTIQIIR
jgi:hypothetical protein